MAGLERALPPLLPGFLPTQRWFGGKARTITRCEVQDAAALPGGDADVAVMIVRVAYDGAPADRYALLVSSRQDPRDLPSIGPRGEPTGGRIVEAATDQDAMRRLLRGFSERSALTTREGGRLVYGDVGERAARGLPTGPASIRPVGAEQSNTSVRIGSSLVFKLFRRLEPGENPEVEIGRFLTARTSFRAMSALEGSLTYMSASGEASTLGVLQTWVDNSGDGWRYVLAGLRDLARTGAPATRLSEDMSLLGTITGDFHAALESDASDEAFAPEPVRSADIRAWFDEIAERAARVAALVRSQLEGWPADTRQLGASFLSKLDAAADLVSARNRSSADFQKIRIHGDYHLGQTLKTPNGFAIIDFEGEPARPISERRQKHCALKDVAGMLRSFDYAIETASEGTPAAADALRASIDLRAAFLRGYLGSATGHAACAVPSDPASLANWLTVFEFEKALYELEYEVNNRPAWAHIPLRGLLRALEGGQA